MQNNPLVHFALVGGAKGHFPLGQTAYDGATLNTAIQCAQRKAWVAKKYAHAGWEKLACQRNFRWYQSDFGRPEAWLKQSSQICDRDKFVQFIPFDWSLNGHCHADTKVPQCLQLL